MKTDGNPTSCGTIEDPKIDCFELLLHQGIGQCGPRPATVSMDVNFHASEYFKKALSILAIARSIAIATFATIWPQISDQFTLRPELAMIDMRNDRDVAQVLADRVSPPSADHVSAVAPGAHGWHLAFDDAGLVQGGHPQRQSGNDAKRRRLISEVFDGFCPSCDGCFFDLF